MRLPLGLTYKEGWLPGLVTVDEGLVSWASSCKSLFIYGFAIICLHIKTQIYNILGCACRNRKRELCFQNMSNILIVHIYASEKNHELPQVT